MSDQISEQLRPGRPIVLRGGTVLPMDATHSVLRATDVLVVSDRIEAIGPNLTVPDGTLEIDAAGGIVMPGMVDTHRHMWQTAMRGYGADWTLTQYFVFYYLQHGKTFRPEDIHAGTLLSAIEALDAGVTTTVDWSHNNHTTQHADAAVDALEAIPGRFVFGYGNIQAGAWEWTATPEFRDFVERRMHRGDLLGFQLAFDVTGDPAFPEKAAFEVARELGANVTTHAGVWGATNDDGIRLMHENGFMTPGTVYVHAATLSDDSYQRIAATGGSVSVSTESEQSCGQGYPPTWRCASTAFRCRSRWTPASGGAATCSRRCGRRSARTARGSTWRRTRPATPSRTRTCAPTRSWSGRRGAARQRSASTTSSAGSHPASRPTWP